MEQEKFSVTEMSQAMASLCVNANKGIKKEKHFLLHPTDGIEDDRCKKFLKTKAYTANADSKLSVDIELAGNGTMLIEVK